MGLFADLLNKYPRKSLTYGIRDTTAPYTVPDGAKVPIRVDLFGNPILSVAGAPLVDVHQIPTTHLWAVGADGSTNYGRTKNWSSFNNAAVVDGNWILTLNATAGASPPTIIHNRATVYVNGSGWHLSRAAVAFGNTSSGGYLFRWGITNGRGLANFMAVDFFGWEFENGVMYAVLRNLGATKRYPQSQWNRNKVSHNPWLQGTIVTSQWIGEGVLAWYIGDVLVHVIDYTNARVFDPESANTSIKTPFAVLGAQGITTTNISGPLPFMVHTISRIATAGVEPQVEPLIVLGREWPTVSSGVTVPLIALQPVDTINGISSGLRHFPLKGGLYTNGRRFEIDMLMATLPELAIPPASTPLTGASFTLSDQSDGLLVDRSASAVAVNPSVRAKYLIAEPIIVQSTTTQPFRLDDHFGRTRHILATRGNGDRPVFLMTAKNIDGSNGQIVLNSLTVDEYA